MLQTTIDREKKGSPDHFIIYNRKPGASRTQSRRLCVLNSKKRFFHDHRKHCSQLFCPDKKQSLAKKRNHEAGATLRPRGDILDGYCRRRRPTATPSFQRRGECDQSERSGGQSHCCGTLQWIVWTVWLSVERGGESNDQTKCVSASDESGLWGGVGVRSSSALLFDILVLV